MSLYVRNFVSNLNPQNNGAKKEIYGTEGIVSTIEVSSHYDNPELVNFTIGELVITVNVLDMTAAIANASNVGKKGE